MSLKRLAALPRFVDPLTRLTAGNLLRGLRLQSRATATMTTAEMEVRLGTFEASRRRRGSSAVTVLVTTAAALDENNQHLYTFQPGLTAAAFERLLSDVVAAGLARASAVEGAVDTLILHGSAGRRFIFHVSNPSSPSPSSSFGGGGGGKVEREEEPLTDHLMKFMNPRWESSIGNTGSGSGDGRPSWQQQQHSRVRVSSTVGAAAATPIATLSHSMRKISSSGGGADLCCPEWGSDLRFALATEVIDKPFTNNTAGSKSSGSGGTIISSGLCDPFELVRLRRRVSLPVAPYFRLEISAERFGTDAAAYEQAIAQAVAATAVSVGSALCINARLNAHQPTLRYHAEVEVDLPALLRDWKRYHGCATVGTVTSTTAAGAAAPPSLADTASADPFLVQVSQDLLTLLQFVARKR